MPTFEAEGTSIYYEDEGTGHPILLIHTAAASSRWFGDMIDRLAKTRRVIAPDLRGLGRSSRVSSLASPRVWVDDMWCTLDAAGVTRTDLIGVSLGSRIAGRMALEKPDRIRALVVDAPIVAMSAHGNSALNTTYTSIDENSEQAKTWRDFHGEDWRDAVAFYGRTRSADGFQDFYSVEPRLSEIPVPTLICRGDLDDSIHPIDDAVSWHKRAPRTRLFIAPGSSDSSVIKERPDEFVELLDAFIDDVERQAI